MHGQATDDNNRPYTDKRILALCFPEKLLARVSEISPSSLPSNPGRSGITKLTDLSGITKATDPGGITTATDRSGITKLTDHGGITKLTDCRGIKNN